jgi:glycosyltransferase involved in cell wall biosynthesis
MPRLKYVVCKSCATKIDLMMIVLDHHPPAIQARMRISMIGPVYPYRGGIAHYTTSLAQALKSSGHDIQMISYRRQYPAFLYPGQSDKDPSAEPFRVDAQYPLDPLYPWTWNQTAATVKSSQPDLVLVQWWTTFWAPAYTALVHKLRKHVPVVYVIHNVLPHEAKPWDRWLARLALQKGHAFIVQAPHERQKLLGLIPKARVSYCTLPIYQRFSEQKIPKEIARRQLGVPVDCPMFLFFGIVRPYKGLKHLVEAMARVNAPAHLLIAGEFWDDLAPYRKQIEQLGIQARITIISKYVPNEEAHILFSAADALVAPYVDGTQSAAVGVALGYGLPIVATEKIASGIDAGAEGVHIVRAGDAEGLADAMVAVITALPVESTAATSRGHWMRLVKVIEELQHLISES